MVSKLGVSVTTLAVFFAVVAVSQAADPAAVCTAKRIKCVDKAAKGLLKCHAKAEKAGTVVDPACVQKVTDKLADSTKGCLAKTEAKGGCPVTGIEGSIVTAVDTFVTVDVVPALDPFYPAAIPSGSVCSSKKKICVAKKTSGLLKCYAKAQKKGLAVDPACLQKATDKFDGGAKPEKGCFARLETRDDCLSDGDSAALEAVVDAFVEDTVCVIRPTLCPGVTTTTSTTTTTLQAPGVVLQGVLPPTTGRFNYNLTIGVPGADAACSTSFPGSHACEISELQAAEAAGDLVGRKDTGGATVTSFWAIDPGRPNADQCTVTIAWDYQTAHTGQFADRTTLNNPAGTLGSIQSGQICATTSWVGCCL